jgi:UPF0042 nucleotide-binding protein
MAAQRFIIVSGLSGAGKTIALHALEDAGFYCVDNLPAGFLAQFADFVAHSELPHYTRVAVGVDARNPDGDLRQLPEILDQLRGRPLGLEVLFIEASDQALINRFSETRRKHPLSTSEIPLRQAIALERSVLEPVIARADLRIDTTHSHIHEFRSLVHEQVSRRERRALALQVCSFGYKNGVPPDADFIFDARCLPNPHWDPHLRDLTGRDQPVRDFLDRTDSATELLTDITVFLDKWIPRFEQEDRSYLTIGVGCTGGRHRSVYLAERLAAHFRSRWHIVLTHRDL